MSWVPEPVCELRYFVASCPGFNCRSQFEKRMQSALLAVENHFGVVESLADRNHFPSRVQLVVAVVRTEQSPAPVMQNGGENTWIIGVARQGQCLVAQRLPLGARSSPVLPESEPAEAASFRRQVVIAEIFEALPEHQ